MIPQCNPKANYLKYKLEINEAISKALDSGWYVLGNEVSSFESEFAKYNNSRSAVGVANGTDAIILGLMALGLQPGDRVITVSHTAVATVNAIQRAGLIPVFIDIDPDLFNMDAALLERALDNQSYSKTKAVIFVHIYGNSSHIQRISKICSERNIPLIEDCSQAHGAENDGKKVGNFGNLGTFSFYPTKNLGAIGDGGAIVANDENLASEIKILREYGWRERYVSHDVGMNSRLDELQAAILRVKLKYLNSDLSKRIDIASRYNTEITNPKVQKPIISKDIKHVFHQYVIKTENRDFFRKALEERGIGTSIHYPKPVHEQPAYKKYIDPNLTLASTEKISQEILSLPMYPEMSKKNITQVIEAVNTI